MKRKFGVTLRSGRFARRPDEIWLPGKIARCQEFMKRAGAPSAASRRRFDRLRCCVAYRGNT